MGGITDCILVDYTKKGGKENKMSLNVKTISSFLLTTFVIWYLLRRTALGQAYTSDMFSIPQYFTSFVGAGGVSGGGGGRSIGSGYTYQQNNFRS
jgi:hypothetical protein